MEARIAALELLMHELVLVLEAEGPAFSGSRLGRWLDTVRAAMTRHASAPPAHVLALERLQAQVLA